MDAIYFETSKIYSFLFTVHKMINNNCQDMAINKIVQIKSNGFNVYIVIITEFVFIASGNVGL